MRDRRRLRRPLRPALRRGRGDQLGHPPRQPLGPRGMAICHRSRRPPGAEPALIRRPTPLPFVIPANAGIHGHGDAGEGTRPTSRPHPWIPASAGMTKEERPPFIKTVIPAKAGIQNRYRCGSCNCVGASGAQPVSPSPSGRGKGPAALAVGRVRVGAERSPTATSRPAPTLTCRRQRAHPIPSTCSASSSQRISAASFSARAASIAALSAAKRLGSRV